MAPNWSSPATTLCCMHEVSDGQTRTKAEDAVMIFISKNATLERQKMIENFLGKERYGIWLCPVYRGEQQHIDTAANLKFMTREVEKG